MYNGTLIYVILYQVPEVPRKMSAGSTPSTLPLLVKPFFFCGSALLGFPVFQTLFHNSPADQDFFDFFHFILDK